MICFALATTTTGLGLFFQQVFQKHDGVWDDEWLHMRQFSVLNNPDILIVWNVSVTNGPFFF